MDPVVHSPNLPVDNVAPPPLKTRKRQCDEDSDTHSESLSMTGDDSSDTDGFTLVEGRRTRRARKKASSHSSDTIIDPTPGYHFTVVFVPTLSAGSVSKISRSQLSKFLEALAPGEIKEARVNTRKNVVAVDACGQTAVSNLLSTSALCGVPVRSYLPRGKDTIVGVIQDVDVDIPDKDLVTLVSSTTVVSEVRRFGTSQSVKIVFRGDCLPATVKVGLVRHPVRPYVPRPLQCRNCMKIGHVAGACPSHDSCGHCGSDHKSSECTSRSPQCVNCHGEHDASSKDCPRLRKELKICQRMARDNSTHKEASVQVQKAIRRKSRSVSKRRAVPALSQQPLSPTSPAVGPQVHARPKTVGPGPPAVSYASVCTTNQAERPSRPTLPHLPVSPAPSTSPIVPSTTDAKIFAMLKTLISVLRGLISNIHTPAANAATQILDTIIPVMDCLETSQ